MKKGMIFLSQTQAIEMEIERVYVLGVEISILDWRVIVCFDHSIRELLS